MKIQFYGWWKSQNLYSDVSETVPGFVWINQIVTIILRKITGSITGTFIKKRTHARAVEERKKERQTKRERRSQTRGWLVNIWRKNRAITAAAWQTALHNNADRMWFSRWLRNRTGCSWEMSHARTRTDKKNVAVNYLGWLKVSGWLQFPGTLTMQRNEILGSWEFNVHRSVTCWNRRAFLALWIRKHSSNRMLCSG